MCRGRERQSGAGVLHEVLPSSPVFIVVSRKSMGLLKLFLLSFFLDLYLFICVWVHIYLVCVWDRGQLSSLLMPCGIRGLNSGSPA